MAPLLVRNYMSKRVQVFASTIFSHHKNLKMRNLSFFSF